MAYVGKLIVDAVVAALDVYRRRASPNTCAARARARARRARGANRGRAARHRLRQSLLRVLLSQRVHLLIRQGAHARTAQFEDSEFYDKMNRARMEASVDRCRS
jgi:hypothetical protein